MPAESSVRRQTRALFEGFLGKKSAASDGPDTDPTPEKVAESLERSLTKDDPLLESNTFNADEDDTRKNSKNKRREEIIVDNDDDKINNSETKLEQHRVKWSSTVTVHDGEADVKGVPVSTFPKSSILKKVQTPQLSYVDMPEDRSLHSSDLDDTVQSKRSFADDSFYPSCGNPTLQRESLVNLDENELENSVTMSSTSGVISKTLERLMKKLSSSTESLDSRGSLESPSKIAKKAYESVSNWLSPSKSSLNDSAESTSHITGRGTLQEQLSAVGSGFQTLWKAKSQVIRELFIEQAEEKREELESDKDKLKSEVEDEKSKITEPLPASPQPKKEKWYKQFKFPLKRKKTPDSESIRSDAGSPELSPDVQNEEKNDVPEKTEDQTLIDQPGTSNQELDWRQIEESEEKEDETTKISSTSIIDDQDVTGSDLPSNKPVPRPRKLPEIVSSVAIPDSEESQPTIERTKSTARRRRRKKVPRKNKREETSPDEEGTTIENTATTENLDENTKTDQTEPTIEPLVEQPAEAEEPPTEDDGTVLGVTVHHSDHLRADLKYMAHPVVRVSIVDGISGSYLQKSNNSRRVTSFYESDSVTSVLPIMTQPYDFRANQSVLPRWEETLVFNESFSRLVSIRSNRIPPVQTDSSEIEAVPQALPGTAPSPIIFFVIRDFVSMSKANNIRKNRDDVDKGWHNVAWAFLKLVGSHGKPNTGRRVRLQLFHPPRNPSAISLEGQTEPAYSWWCDKKRVAYPSTLYVTLKSITGTTKMDAVPRSMFAMQPECGARTFNQMHSSLQFADGTKSENQMVEAKWSRLPGQTCKIPNTVALKLWAGADGAFTIRFSKSGTRLAVACKHGPIYPILLYRIPSGEEMGALVGHQQLVYDIQWSNDSTKLVSASADGTAQVWDLDDKSKPSHTLVHPSYVYTSAFHPTAQYIVATGGYDCIIRVWNIDSSTAQMLQELDGHKSLINSLAFDFSGLTLYSADGAGVVVAWNCHSHEKPRKKHKTEWTFKTKYAEKDLSGVCINCIQVHPRNNKLLLHCRDSTIRMLDVRIHTFLKYSGSSNLRQLIRSDLTSCGSFVISGSEDGCAYVWNAESGDQVAKFNELQFSRSVRDVTFHPHDHIVAFSCFAPNMPVLVYKYDRQVAAVDAGLAAAAGSSTQVDNATSGGLPMITESRLGESYRGGNKMDQIRQQLDNVARKGEDSWDTARQLLPLSMAVRAFKDGIPSPQSSPRRVQIQSPATSRGRYHSPTRDHLSPFGPNNTMSTWGSTFDSTHMLEPSYLSPHATPEARVIAQHYAQHQPKEEEQHGWKPTFAAVGGSPYRSGLGSSMGPDVTLTMDDVGNTSLKVTSVPGVKPQHTVVALYDYQANRSDELTIFRGDVIRVLYKDGPTWWFGEMLSDSKQGYFPSNYVAINDDETVDEKLEKQERSPEVMFGVPDERPISAESTNDKTTHALKMPGGKVHFYSQDESEGDEERLSTLNLSMSSRQRRRQSRLPTNPVAESRLNADIARTTDEVSKVDDATNNTTVSNDITDDVISTTPQPRARSTLKTRKSSKTTKSPKSSPRDQQAPRKLPDLPPQPPTPSKHVTIAEVHEETRNTPVPRKQRPKKKADNLENAPVSEVSTPVTPPAQKFGILKSVQARLASESLFSDSVLGGAGVEMEKTNPNRLAPILTSTASKPKKERPPNRKRKKPPKVLITEPSQDDDDVIPMLDLGTSIVGGHTNPTFNNSSEV